MGQKTNLYVQYCMKYIHMLLYHKIRPILVFDGQHLPAKAETEAKRKDLRSLNRKKAAELLRIGQKTEGQSLLRRSIDVTHEMALELIKCCQVENIDCIVAPYEADAQLAYLSINGFADIVITEDSDLILFGCNKIFFKMDLNGNGLLVEHEKLYLSMDGLANHFDFEKFQHMCILSGCDYLESLPGIGLAKARKFVLKNTDNDVHKALVRLGSYLNMKSLVVTEKYRDAFMRALLTFKHQLVYCPQQRQQVRMTPLPPDIKEDQLHFAGVRSDSDVALQLALGNMHPFTLKKLHDFDPDSPKLKMRLSCWNQHNNRSDDKGTWKEEFNNKEQLKRSNQFKSMLWPDTAGKKTVLSIKTAKVPSVSDKTVEPDIQLLGDDEILCMYSTLNICNEQEMSKQDNSPPNSKLSTSRILKSKDRISPILISTKRRKLKMRNMVAFRRTILDENVLNESKYFARSATETTITNEKENSLGIQDESVEEISKRELPKIHIPFKKIYHNRESALNMKQSCTNLPIIIPETCLDTLDDNKINFVKEVDVDYTSPYVFNNKAEQTMTEISSTCVIIPETCLDMGIATKNVENDSFKNEASQNISKISTNHSETISPDCDFDFLVSQNCVKDSECYQLTAVKTKQSSSMKKIPIKANRTVSRKKITTQGFQPQLSMFGFHRRCEQKL
ncbi:exonuclease 1 [Prorops nasuta]|uniref:exonuclease 1 n=1 Tax=Prorops nasuta TaxID=863751 RepID=UPI0034CEE044